MLRRSNLNLTNNVVGSILLVLAVGLAVTLVWVGQSGGFEMVVFISVGTLVTIAALSSLEFGLMSLILVAATDGFLKGLSPGWHTQLLKDYVIALCLLRWAWLSVLGYSRKSVKHPIGVPVLVFGGWVVVEYLNARSGSLVVGLAGLRMWTIWLPTFFLAYDMIQSRRQIERMVLFIIGLMAPLALYGILQYYLGLDHLYELSAGFDVYRQASYAGSVGEELRPPSTMISPHALAGTLTMVVLMGLGATVYFHRNRLLQLALLASVPLMGMAILITAVRNAAGSLAVGVLAFLLLIRRFDLAVLIAVIGGLAVLQVDAMTGGEALERIRSIVDNPAYTQRRILAPWHTAVAWATRNPLGAGIASGMGTGRVTKVSLRGVSPEYRMPSVENEYARALLELGVPGFLLLVWVLITVTRHGLKAYRMALERRDRLLIAGFFAACVSILARLLVGPALYGWPEAPLFWYFVAMAARLPEIEEQEHIVAQAPDTEARATVLDPSRLPWARDADQGR